LLSVILFLLTLTLYLGRINPIDSDGYFLTNDGMKAGKDVFQLFGIIRSNSRDIFRVGEFMTEHNLGKWHHVYDGHGKIFTINGQQIAMFSVDGELFAFDDECPHVGGSLGSGKLEGKLVTCPAHQWQFDITTGECITVDRCDDGCYVDTYPVKIENDEIILSLPL